ncbi:MAG TPA: UbiA family prenyltransferase [Oligoflexia bacterium]|nr:UbiA family prenyltransferase [Oligoflexia bacterium]HMP27017.1 UbiA family prenyltransferase [Oligoflexia bacterium]
MGRELESTKRTIPKKIFVDLDGTLLLSDSVWELVVMAIKITPLELLFSLWGLLWSGRALFKERLTRAVLAAATPENFNVKLLPYNKALIDQLSLLKKEGCSLILATGANQLLAEKIVELDKDFFDGYIASDHNSNRTGQRKLELITANSGGDGFGYIGNSVVDLPIWREAVWRAFVCNSWLTKKMVSSVVFDLVVDVRSSRLKALLKALRPYQWIKNILIFAPAILAHTIFDLSTLIANFWGFVSFSLLASTIYLINDAFDLFSDRAHPKKRFRPFASGSLPVGSILFFLPLFGSAAFLIALSLGGEFLFVLISYLLLNLLYTFRLKQLLVIDLIILATLYILRLSAGAAVSKVELSPWLFLFSLFIFFSLACLKRYSEINQNLLKVDDKLSGRAYKGIDLSILQNLGVVSGMLSVLVVALYINSPTVWKLYLSPNWLWIICPALLGWITALWISSARGEYLEEDPIILSFKHPATYFALITIVFSIIAATSF